MKNEESGYWVVDSVLAASGDPKKYAVAWFRDVIAAVLFAGTYSENENKDYIVLDANNRVV